MAPCGGLRGVLAAAGSAPARGAERPGGRGERFGCGGEGGGWVALNESLLEEGNLQITLLGVSRMSLRSRRKDAPGNHKPGPL